MITSTKKDNNKSTSHTKGSDKSKEKITGPEELGNGVSNMIKGTTDSLFNILAATYELTMSGVSKLSEKFGNQTPEIKNNRKAITKHHLHQTKKSINKVGKGVVKISKGGFHTTKGAIRTVLSSGKETVQGLREDENENKDKNKK